MINIYVEFVDDDKQHFLSSPFQLGDTSELNALLKKSGLESAELSGHKMKTHWPDIRSLILADARGWFPLAGISLSDDQLEEVIEAWTLHAWIWYPNPEGVFHPTNPRVNQ